VTLNALKAFGRNARGVAIVYPKITGTELKTLADGAAGRIALINSLGNLAGFVDRRHQRPDGKLFSNCSEASG
jgi:hypothetical protein